MINFIKSKPNTWYLETDEATKHYEKGIEEQRKINNLKRLGIDSGSYRYLQNNNIIK